VVDESHQLTYYLYHFPYMRLSIYLSIVLVTLLHCQRDRWLFTNQGTQLSVERQMNALTVLIAEQGVISNATLGEWVCGSHSSQPGLGFVMVMMIAPIIMITAVITIIMIIIVIIIINTFCVATTSTTTNTSAMRIQIAVGFREHYLKHHVFLPIISGYPCIFPLSRCAVWSTRKI